MTGRRAGLGLALAFLLFSLPLAADVRRYHGDERFYTDAAIGMQRSGEWLTPRFADGRLRFEKPLLTYAALLASYGALGVSPLSSRLPFLLAGALLVLCTFRTAQALLGPAETSAAALAAGIVAATPHVTVLAVRSTPDILLCLFLLLAFSGFVRLLRGDAPTPGALASAWLGLGAAVAVKGGLAAVMLALVALAAGLSTDRRRVLGRILHPVWTPLGLAIAAAGFGLFALEHGAEALQRSLEDQAGARRIRTSSYLPGLLAYSRVSLEQFAPWIALAVVGLVAAPGAAARFLRAHRFTVTAALSWLLACIALFALGGMIRGRYLAPAYAPVAIVLAGVLVEAARTPRGARTFRRLATIVLVAFVVAGGVAAAALLRLGAVPGLAALAAAAVSALALAAARRGDGAAPLVAVAIGLLALQTLGAAAGIFAFARSPVPALAARLVEPELAGLRVAQIGESAHLSSKLRIATGGSLEIVGHTRGKDALDLTAWDVVISDEPLPDAEAAGFRVETCGVTTGDSWTAEEVVMIVGAEDPKSALARREKPYFLAVRGAPAGR